VPRSARHLVVDLVRLVAIVLALVLVTFTWIVKPYTIPTPSMVPTLAEGDYVLAARFLSHLTDPSRGDIIVFNPNGSGVSVFRTNTASDEVYIKRLIGLPNEVVGSRGGRVWVCSGSDEPADLAHPDLTRGCRFLVEPYVHGKATGECPPSGGDLAPIHIPPGRYLMLGDNRIDSNDGRCWGLIRESQMIGRAVVRYWPFSRLGTL
jgi:signal peptidase I